MVQTGPDQPFRPDRAVQMFRDPQDPFLGIILPFLNLGIGSGHDTPGGKQAPKGNYRIYEMCQDTIHTEIPIKYCNTVTAVTRTRNCAGRTTPGHRAPCANFHMDYSLTTVVVPNVLYDTSGMVWRDGLCRCVVLLARPRSAFCLCARVRPLPVCVVEV